MSRFYRELSDRELLLQGELILTELTKRRLVDLEIPSKDGDDTVLISALSRALQEDGRLVLTTDPTFVWPKRAPAR
jgi:hypothetical protein